MFSTKLAALAAVVSFGLFAAGCAAETESASSSTESDVRTSESFVDFADGTFSLYDAPNSEVTEACDVHTVITLTHSDKGGASATLRDVVTGVCYLYVLPNERTFELTVDTNRCGTQTFSGETQVAGETRHLAITDSRKSLCAAQKGVAELIVDEYGQDGAVTTRYTQK